jgi:hypothetical protein
MLRQPVGHLRSLKLLQTITIFDAVKVRKRVKYPKAGLVDGEWISGCRPQDRKTSR